MQLCNDFAAELEPAEQRLARRAGFARERRCLSRAETGSQPSAVAGSGTGRCYAYPRRPLMDRTRGHRVGPQRSAEARLANRDSTVQVGL